MTGCACCCDALRVVRLRCEYRTDPIGIDTTPPRLTWTLESSRRGAHPTAWQLSAASSPERLDAAPDLWDSGRVASPDAHALYAGTMPASRQRCFWRVRVWDERGAPSAWSPTAFFEMGLLEASDWRGAWIGMNPEARGKAAPLLRREFSLPAEVRRARLYLCGLGWHEAHINGRTVGDHVLDPAQTDYPKRCFYVTHDVTDLVHAGENALGVILGDGWYNQYIVWADRNKGVPLVYGEPRLLAQLEIDLADGSRQIVATGPDWRAATGPVTSNNVYAGETHDARLERNGWDTPTYDDTAWTKAVAMEAPGGALRAQPLPPMRRQRELTVQSVAAPSNGAFVLDFGENFAGWVRVRLQNMAAGTTVRMRFAETVHPDGAIDPASTGVFATHVVQTDEYICRGAAEEVWEPRFTWHGFRYVEVTGLNGPPPQGMFTGIVVHSDLPTAGNFACSDPMLNRLHDMAVRTHLSNAHSIPEDCPARERCGWLADAALVSEYSLFNLDSVAFWRKYLDDIETTRDGGMPFDIAPGLRRCGRGIPDWVRAQIFIPWILYLHTGDTRLLSEHWDGMRLVMESFGQRAENWILARGRGDWCDPTVDTRPAFTPEALTTTAWFFHDARIMTRAAARLDREADAARYDQWAAAIRHAFIERFYNPAARTFGSQTANAMALAFGLAPPQDAPAVADALARDILETRNLHFTTGIFGVRYLGEALAAAGHGQIALRLFNQTTPPSFGHLIAQGATTLWEYWAEPEVDAADGPRSLSHPMFGGFDTWFFEGIAGIRPDPDRPGFQHFFLSPQFIPGLQWARATHRSVRGQIATAWRREPGGPIRWQAALPPGTTCTARLPIPPETPLREGGRPAPQAPGVEIVRRDPHHCILRLLPGIYSFEWED